MSNADNLGICLENLKIFHLGAASPSTISCHCTVNSLVFIICSKTGDSV